MLKRFTILVLPVALAGCAVGHVSLPMSPMALGPSDSPPPSCLTYSGAPAYGNCKDAGAVSVPQQDK